MARVVKVLWTASKARRKPRVNHSSDANGYTGKPELVNQRLACHAGVRIVNTCQYICWTPYQPVLIAPCYIRHIL